MKNGNKEIDSFINQNNIRPADAIVVKKASGILDHYVIYLGQDYWGKHYFSANLRGVGVKLIPEEEALSFLQRYTPTRLNRFTGNEQERAEALERAYKYPNEGYDLIANNCEHYANAVQTGVRFSAQTNAAIGVGAVALLFGLASLLDKD